MELMIEKLLGFVMVLTRLSAFFLVIPIFGSRIITARFKVTLVMFLAIFFTMIHPPFTRDKGISELEAILFICNEAIYGLGLGLIVVLIFSAVKLSGRIIERQMGLAMAQTLDPLTGERAQPVGMFLETIFILMFLAANGHHMFLQIIFQSYEIFPAGNIPTISILTEGVIKAGSAMLIAGLRLAAPMLTAFLLLLIILAVFARMMPDMDILFISMSLRVGLGLLMTGMFLPFIKWYISEFADWMDKLLPL